MPYTTCRERVEEAGILSMTEDRHENIHHKDEQGSPWRKPLAWRNVCPADPLIITIVLAIESNKASLALHGDSNLRAHNISSKKGQDTKSKALAMSNFTITDGICFRCSV